MELPEVGANCAFDGCNKLDFLPVTCCYCCQCFCSEHGSPGAHSCTKIPTRDATPASAAADPGPITMYTRPPRTGPKDARPQTKKTLTPEQISALESIKSSGEPVATSKPKKPRTSPTVELMRLKAKATGNASMAMSDRLYLLVKSERKSIAVFINKSAVIGNAAGQFARQLGLPGNKAYRIQVQDSGEALPPNKRFSEILSSESTLYNGCSVCLQ